MENGAKGVVCGLGEGTRFMGCIIWGDNCRFGPPLPGEPAGRNALQERMHHVIELVSSHLAREREGWKERGGNNKRQLRHGQAQCSN